MMSSLVNVILTRLSDGQEFGGFAYWDGERYDAVWYEGGLRYVFIFDKDGVQIGPRSYSLRRPSA